jgi:DNA-binding NtrC family response regulator
MVSDGEFRQDLLFRLNVVQFHLPPLRERKEDIGPLVSHFLGRFAADTKTAPKVMSDGGMSFLSEYDFPGNTRELKNLVERVNIYCEGDVIEASDLERLMPRSRPRESKSLKEATSEFEREYIKAAILRNDGNIAQAAREMGVERSHLYKKMRKLKIQAPRL